MKITIRGAYLNESTFVGQALPWDSFYKFVFVHHSLFVKIKTCLDRVPQKEQPRRLEDSSLKR